MNKRQYKYIIYRLNWIKESVGYIKEKGLREEIKEVIEYIKSYLKLEVMKGGKNEKI